jgi:hypothetical protein
MPKVLLGLAPIREANEDIGDPKSSHSARQLLNIFLQVRGN